ncbi:hypothetical protein QJQ45_028708 [Haematococcus lacustris]|nr:hypothetical protein QJQ45_028708 [Haematococcus lacustris]
MAVNNEEGADEVFLLSTLCAKLQLCLTHAQQENAALQQENRSLRHQLQQSTSICKPPAAPAWVAHQQPALQPYEAWTLHADGSASEPARHGMIEFIESEIRNLQEQLLATRRKLDDAQCGDNAHASAGQPQGSPYMSGRFEDLDLSPNYAGLNRHQRRSGHYQAEVLTVARKELVCACRACVAARPSLAQHHKADSHVGMAKPRRPRMLMAGCSKAIPVYEAAEAKPAYNAPWSCSTADCLQPTIVADANMYARQAPTGVDKMTQTMLLGSFVEADDGSAQAHDE